MTPLQQNCSLIWCTQTNKAALIDPGGDLDKLKAGVAKAGVELEKILIPHGHLDHCGQAGMLAKELGLRIEGPHEADRFWIARLDEDGARFQMEAASFEPDRWLDEGLRFPVMDRSDAEGMGRDDPGAVFPEILKTTNRDDGTTVRRLSQQSTTWYSGAPVSPAILIAGPAAAGGRQRMPGREYFPDQKPYRMVYVEDPFGIVFEVYSHSYELTYSAGAYE